MPPAGCHRLNDWEASVVDEIDGRLVGGLVVFVAVADARGFGRAAERLGMTKSGVSRAIAKLEARVGARLLDRTSRAVTLTDEGRGPLRAGRSTPGRDRRGRSGNIQIAEFGPRSAEGKR